MKTLARPQRIDWFLLVSTVLLTVIGLLILNAINFKDPLLAQDFSPVKQTVTAGVGIFLLMLFMRTDYRLWFRFGIFWYVASLVLLVLTWAVGETAFGAQRSIDLGLIQFQPTEVAKIGLIMVLAKVLSKYHEELSRLRFLGYTLAITALPMALIVIQPDLGSALVLGFIWFLMVATSNISKKQLALLAAIGLAVLPFAISQLQPYQAERLETFMNPTADPQGSGYNVVQSQIAVGSGQLLGRGLGSGSQGQLNFLPSQHTDFVFAILAEKLGFLGASLVILLFVLLLFRAIMVAWRAEDRFGMYLAVGITAMFFFHIVINIGMNLGIMPVTGLPLPLVSYGGTNLIVSLIAIGLLESIVRHHKELQFKT